MKTVICALCEIKTTSDNTPTVKKLLFSCPLHYTASAGKLHLKKVQRFTLTTRPICGDANIVSVSYEGLPAVLRPGNTILADDIRYCVDLIAASFVRCVDDIRQVRQLLSEHGGNNIKMIAKTENAENRFL